MAPGRQARIALWMSCAGIIAFIVAMAVSLSMLISSGLMDKLIDRVKNADPNDPTAITEIQQELMEDLLKRYVLMGHLREMKLRGGSM